MPDCGYTLVHEALQSLVLVGLMTVGAFSKSMRTKYALLIFNLSLDLIGVGQIAIHFIDVTLVFVPINNFFSIVEIPNL